MTSRWGVSRPATATSSGFSYSRRNWRRRSSWPSSPWCGRVSRDVAWFLPGDGPKVIAVEHAARVDTLSFGSPNVGHAYGVVFSRCRAENFTSVSKPHQLAVPPHKAVAHQWKSILRSGVSPRMWVWIWASKIACRRLSQVSLIVLSSAGQFRPPHACRGFWSENSRTEMRCGQPSVDPRCRG